VQKVALWTRFCGVRNGILIWTILYLNCRTSFKQ